MELTQEQVLTLVEALDFAIAAMRDWIEDDDTADDDDLEYRSARLVYWQLLRERLS